MKVILISECDHEWVITKVAKDGDYYPIKKIPIERICSKCGLIMCNYGEDVWDKGRLYNLDSFWSDVVEVKSLEAAVSKSKDALKDMTPKMLKEYAMKKSCGEYEKNEVVLKSSYEINYCPYCGGSIPCSCGFKADVKTKAKVKKINFNRKRFHMSEFGGEFWSMNIFGIGLSVLLMFLMYYWFIMIPIVPLGCAVIFIIFMIFGFKESWY